MRRVDSLEKTLMLGGIGGRRRRGRQRMRWLDGITDSMGWVWVNSGSLWWTGRPGVLQFMGSQRVRHNRATELNWNYGWDKEDNGDLPQKIPCIFCYIPFLLPCSRKPLTHSFYETPGHPQASLLWGHCSFLLGSGAQGSVVPSKSL